MKLTVIGSGYVGLVTSACFAEMGNHVCSMDIDPVKIGLLQKGEVPIYEPGLKEMLNKNVQQERIYFTTKIKEAIEYAEILFIAVGTPQDEDGSANLSYVFDVARDIGKYMLENKVIVSKSTVPVGTGDKIKAILEDELAKRNVKINFSIVSNPEFLKEGVAINDFMRPDRVVIGADDSVALEKIKELYKPFVYSHERILLMDVKSAELTKYAANAMLATRISFMNELAYVAESVGADIENVRQGIGSDTRIGFSFLYAGCGYGGSCFPKDLRALIQIAETSKKLQVNKDVRRNEGSHRSLNANQEVDGTAPVDNFSLQIIRAVERVNEEQKKILGKKIVQKYGPDLTGKIFAIWGLAFKPETDDMRDAPSRVLICELVKRGAKIQAFDPVANHEAQKILKKDLGEGIENVSFASSEFEALKNVNALVLVTEWRHFRSPDFIKMFKLMATPIIFDGRNIYNPKYLKSLGYEYYAIGRGLF